MIGKIDQIVVTADFLRDPDLDIKDSKLQNNVRVLSTLFSDLLGEIAEVPVTTKFESLGGGAA